MRLRSGILWPVGVDFAEIPTLNRSNFRGIPGQIMRLARKGCRNRPFYHIEVTRVSKTMKILIYLLFKIPVTQL